MARTGSNKSPKANPVEEIEGYLDQLEEKLRSEYTVDQRAVFIAALAERHLAKAERSSPEAGQGAAPLHTALEAVWGHVQGQRVPAEVLERLREQVAESGFGESPAQTLARLAVEACLAEDNLPAVRQAARLDYETARDSAPGDPAYLTSTRVAWLQPEVTRAIDYQQALLMHAHLPVLNEYMVDFIKRDARSDTPMQVGRAFFTLPTGPEEPGEPAFRFHFRGEDEIDENLPNSGILGRLSSVLGKLQQGDFTQELLKRVAGGETAGLVTSQAEKAHARLLETSMANWKNEQRAAFAATLAGHWLQEYEAFSSKEDWGEPELLRRSLEAVWNHLLGLRLSPTKARQFSQQILENACDTEDFDAPLALAACEILDLALDCCIEKNNLDSAVSAGMAACSSLAMLGQGLDYRGDDPDEEARLWKQPAIQKEMKFQAKLMSMIAGMDTIGADEVRALSKFR